MMPDVGLRTGRGKGRGARGLVAAGLGAGTAASLAAVLVLGGACGPSFQAIYEGDARFEHCYALEENPLTPMTKKADCWRDWSEHYTYGQTRDRVQYAIARYVALSEASSAPTDEAMMLAAPGVAPRVTSIAAPAPTNAFAPPPKVLSDVPDADVERPKERASDRIKVAAGSPHNPDASSEAVPPSQSCADGCLTDYRACNAQCVGPRADVRALGGVPCRACDGTYRGCMHTCFE